MATPQQLNDFLAATERRAFKIAVFATRDPDAALDIVQDAMIKLADNYGGKPHTELPMLFQRILQNTITDHFRRSKVRNFWVSLFSSFSNHENDDDYDPLETLVAPDGALGSRSPADELDRAQTLLIIEEALEKLPSRQREAFLMRYWEEMDVAETAAAMGCSVGSVKTHCSRAAHALAKAMRSKGIKP